MSLNDVDEYISQGKAFLEKEQYSEAIEQFQKAEVIALELAPESQRLTYIYNELGEAFRGLGLHSQACKCYERMIEIEEKICPNTVSIAITYNNYALSLYNIGEKKEALEFFEKSKKIRESENNPNSKICAVAYNNIANLLKELGRGDEALEYYEKAMGIRDRDEGDEIAAALSRRNIAGVYFRKGDLDKAEENYGKANEIIERIAPEIMSSAHCYAEYAKVLWYQGKKEKALQLIEHSYKIKRNELKDNDKHPYLISDEIFLMQAYFELNNKDKTVQYIMSLQSKDKSLKYAHYYNALCLLEEAEKNDEFYIVLSELEKALEIDNNYADAQLKRLEILLKESEKNFEKKNEESLKELENLRKVELKKADFLKKSEYRENKLNEFCKKLEEIKEVDINRDYLYLPEDKFQGNDSNYKNAVKDLTNKLAGIHKDLLKEKKTVQESQCSCVIF